MEEGDPDKLQEEVDSISRKVSELDKDIEKYDSKDWANTSKCTTTHFKEQKGELLTQHYICTPDAARSRERAPGQPLTYHRYP